MHIIIGCFCFQTLLNAQGMYFATVTVAYLVLLVSAAIAFHMAGGSALRLKQALFCKAGSMNSPTRTVTVDG